jgi:hypothetical protein
MKVGSVDKRIRLSYNFDNLPETQEGWRIHPN